MVEPKHTNIPCDCMTGVAVVSAGYVPYFPPF